MNRRPPKNGEKQIKELKTLLIDGDALFKVAYFAVKDQYNDKGENIGGVYGFFNILRKILTEDLYHRVYVFWDGNFSGKLRYEIYEKYKSARGKDFVNGTQPSDSSEITQRQTVKRYLNDMYVRQLEDPIVETDDFIAFYCLNKNENEKITIVSGDRDFLQLINSDVRIYFLNLKVYVDLENYSNYFPYHQENAVLIKILTGDNSDSIKGIKGLGEDTLLSLFPEIKEKKITLEDIISKAKELQSERISNKLKPLKVLDNIINRITDGIQKEMIYEINTRLVDLSQPMLTNEAIDNLNILMDGTLNDTGRTLKNVMVMMESDGMDKALGASRYSEFLIPFKKLIDRENIFN